MLQSQWWVIKQTGTIIVIDNGSSECFLLPLCQVVSKHEDAIYGCFISFWGDCKINWMCSVLFPFPTISCQTKSLNKYMQYTKKLYLTKITVTVFKSYCSVKPVIQTVCTHYFTRYIYVKDFISVFIPLDAFSMYVGKSFLVPRSLGYVFGLLRATILI